MYSKRLNAEEWAEHHNSTQCEGIVRALRAGALSCQTREILKLTCEGETTLEIGSGSGASSLSLAMNNRTATALDFALPCLKLASMAAQRLGCRLETVHADATAPLSFSEDAFDVIFHAGLLEHFTHEERVSMLSNWYRVGKRMVAMVPNASSLAYRIGKARQERLGLWGYGLEIPLYSLQEEFRAAGYTDIKEYTIGEEHALNFLPKWHPMRLALIWWLRRNECGDNCGQGYLLVTIGKKA